MLGSRIDLLMLCEMVEVMMRSKFVVVDSVVVRLFVVMRLMI